MRPLLYVGLLDYVRKFCSDRDYELRVPRELDEKELIDDDYAYQLAKTIGLPKKFEVRDYQNDYIVNALRERRSLSLSPTSSGKSLIQYLIMRHYYEQLGLRTVIIVPTVGLVHQMEGDFIDYGCDPKLIHKIMSGAEKKTSCPIVVTTWQSLAKMDADYLNSFGVVFGDEAHNFTAKSLTGIMDKMVHVKYRHGFTGTISSESKVHRLVLEGLFGSIKRYVTTKDLMDSGTVADFKVKALILNHNITTKSELRAKQKGADKAKRYAIEKDFLVNMEARNIFLRNLVWSLKGQNNLILFDLVEKHGKVLEPLLRKEGRVLHFIHGGINGLERERIRHEIENDQGGHEIVLTFGDKIISVDENIQVPLSNGKTKYAKDLSEKDDVSDTWIDKYTTRKGSL